MKQTLQFIKSYGLYCAWLISIVATGGSLYFSEILGWIPCSLCWYQRILMYPLVILLGIATYRDDRTSPIYLLPLSITGASISLFHYLQQKVPVLGNAVSCQSGVPCNMEYMNLFQFITIPFLAFVAFVLITICLVLVRKKNGDSAEV